MPSRRPRFWFEMLLLGLVLVFGMASLSAWLNSPWVNIMRVLFAAALLLAYGSYYERTWGQKK